MTGRAKVRTKILILRGLQEINRFFLFGDAKIWGYLRCKAVSWSGLSVTETRTCSTTLKAGQNVRFSFYRGRNGFIF